MIVVTGASGLLGYHLMLELAKQRIDAQGLYHKHPLSAPGVRFSSMDLTQKSERDRHILDLKPEWIIHCAAQTNVDWCESNPTEARQLNVDISKELAVLAKTSGARFVYISTDSVFDGMRGHYGEGDTASPVNVYAKTKWEGEQAVQSALPEALVLRTNFYGCHVTRQNSLAEWLLQSIEKQTPIVGFMDVIFSPLYVGDLAMILLELVSQKAHGLYHVGASDSCSKYDFALRMAEAFGLRAHIKRGSIRDVPLKAKRPLNTSLNTTKLQHDLHQKLPDLNLGLLHFKESRQAGITNV